MKGSRRRQSAPSLSDIGDDDDDEFIDGGSMEEKDEEFEPNLGGQPPKSKGKGAWGTFRRKPAASSRTETYATKATRRSRTRTDPETEKMPGLLDSTSDEDQPPRCLPASKATSGPAGSRREQQRGGPVRRRALSAAALSEDGDDCLVDTGTDSNESASDGESEKRDDDNYNDGPVLCRCGARDWKDGTRWIRCDNLECRTWEHLPCVYPMKEEAPKVHLCPCCKLKGRASVLVTPRQKRELAQRKQHCLQTDRGRPAAFKRSSEYPSLSESAMTPHISFRQHPSKTPLGGEDKQKYDHKGGGDGDVQIVAARRSRRVARQEEMRPLLRKNVVGEEFSMESSCSEGVGEIGSSDGYGSDKFWAPEGKVEATREFQCRCGATSEIQGIGGGVSVPPGDAACFVGGVTKKGGRRAGGGRRLVQCRFDSCGVWEHAGCCEYGCSAEDNVLSGDNLSQSVVEQEKHWCHACDPRGKKHTKWQHKRRQIMKRRRRAEKKKTLIEGDGSGVGAGPALEGKSSDMGVGEGKSDSPASQCAQQIMDRRSEALLRVLWGAVAAGNAPLVEKYFQEIEGENAGKGNQPNDAMQRLLLKAGPPPPSSASILAVEDSVDGEGAKKWEEALGGDGDFDKKSPKGVSWLPTTGVTLLMLAAGYWKNVCVHHETTAAVAATFREKASPLPRANSPVIHSALESYRNTGEQAAVDVEEIKATSAPVAAEAGSLLSGGEKPSINEEGRTTDGLKAPVAPKNEKESIDVDSISARTGLILMAKEAPAAGAEGATDKSNPTGVVALKEDVKSNPTGVVALKEDVHRRESTKENTLPHLGSKARLVVLRSVLRRSGERAVLAVDGEGKTAVHHAVAANGFDETVLLLEASLGEEAALVKVRWRRKVMWSLIYYKNMSGATVTLRQGVEAVGNMISTDATGSQAGSAAL